MKGVRIPSRLLLAFIIFSFLLNTISVQGQDTLARKLVLPRVGTSTILGKIDGISIGAKVMSPAYEETPLQIICVFEYTEGDIFNPPALPDAANGIVHVDKQLHGLITDLRKSGKFAGHALETLLIIPPKGTIPAKRLLLIGLGDRSKFFPGLMTDVGRIGMREALRLGVTSYTHASDLKDGGVGSPTALVAQNVVKGAMEAYETDRYLVNKHASPRKQLTTITLLTGQPFYDISGKAIIQFIQNYNTLKK